MRKIGFTILSLLILLIYACDSQIQKEEHNATPAQDFIQPIQRAHKDSIFQTHSHVQFDLKLIFSSKLRFDGQVYIDLNNHRVKMQDSSKTMIWDGENAYVFPANLDYSKARFDLLTWSYFFLAPYKLDDPGTHFELLGLKKLNDKNFEAGKLSFDKGVGDSPDDWYICYQDPESELLAAMAYIVTYFKKTAEAEKDPHCISYEAYESVGGIPFATVWNFWTWNEAGELNKLLGTAQISQIQFTKKAPGFFEPDATFSRQ